MHSNFREYSDEQVDTAVMQALEEVDLPPSYRITIRSLVRSRAQNWRSCCGGSCNPCIGKVEEAVDRACELLVSARDASHDTVPVPRAADPAPTGPHEVPAESSSVSSPEDDTEARNWGLDYA